MAQAAWLAKRTLRVDEAAAVLGVSRRTVYYWIRAGRLEAERGEPRSQRVLSASVARARQAAVVERLGPAVPDWLRARGAAV
ncbi:MAG: helix-turn-helix domain-containing protein [Acidobacteria bacterium]|nr:helix-turn-helix domain-containing protein [Acidobacteriota bacterium]